MEFISLIERVYEDGIVKEDEAKDILCLCNNFVMESTYYEMKNIIEYSTVEYCCKRHVEK